MNKVAKGYLFAILLVICGLASFAGQAKAQGSRKDDIVFNAQGRPLAGAAVRICTSGATGQPCSPLANLYSDAALTQALANPLSTDGLGNYTFYAAPGRYEVEISGPGITTKQLPNVILPSDPSTPTFTSVTTTSGISAFSLSLTGNLTVSGSTSVAGSLSVGGAPVPSTTADNLWTSAQRFKGPIPYRDFTAYMPAGGCSSTLLNSVATGTISSGSPNLALSAAADIKNGCDVAVIGAGPTTTVALASSYSGSVQKCANPPSCSTQTGTQIAFTVSSGSMPLIPNVNFTAQAYMNISGCSDASFDTTVGMQAVYGTPVTMFLYTLAGTGTSTTGCTATLYYGYAHGTTGSTTYNYYVAPVDANGGVGAAIGPITITNGASTLTWYNYNWIIWQDAPNARMFAIYSDKGLGGAASCINMAYGRGFSDWGTPLPNGCPPYVPSTPPVSPTADTLTAKVLSGGGTTSLVLGTAASNNATSQDVFDTVTPFLTSCLTDAIADQNMSRRNGGNGCYIPYGRWPFEGDMPTDTLNPVPAGGARLLVSGTVALHDWPWMVGGSYAILGEGNSAGVASAQNYPSVYIETETYTPAGWILRGSGIDIENFSMANNFGDGIFITSDPSTGALATGITMNDIVSSQASNTAGVPFVMDGNTFFSKFYNMNLIPSTACSGSTVGPFPASVLFTGLGYNGTGVSDIEFKNLYTQYHSFFVDAPGGYDGGQGVAITQTGWWDQEDHGNCTTGGAVTVDSGAPNLPPGAVRTYARLQSAVFNNTQNADAFNKYLYAVEGSQTVQTSFLSLTSSDSYNENPLCMNGATICSTGNVSVTISQNGNSLAVGGQNPTTGPSAGGIPTYVFANPLVYMPTYGSFNQTPPSPSAADSLAAPSALTVSSTGSGSLGAGTYCMVVAGYDSQPTAAGLTLPSPEICSTVGGSSDIVLHVGLVENGEVYTGFRLYYGTSAGGENNYLDMGITPTNTTTLSYTFTSTSGATGGTPPVLPTAYLTWMDRDITKPSCVLCVPGTLSYDYPLGIGDSNPPSGAKASIKGGYLNLNGTGLAANLVTKSTAYTLTTNDFWVNVTGTTTITVPHAQVGHPWTVFNSGSNTVTIQADSGNINGAANITLAANTGKEIACDGTNCFAH